MTDRPQEPRFELEHIVVPGEPLTERFQRRGGGGDRAPKYPIQNRRGHADKLTADLQRAVDASLVKKQEWDENLRSRGIILTVTGWPGGFELAVKSLDLRSSGIELLSVQPGGVDDQEPEVATVFVPDNKANIFFGRLDRYASENTLKGKPKHQPLVGNIASMQLATLEQLWTDRETFPGDVDAFWWEVWLRRTGDELEVLEEVAAHQQWHIAERAVAFPGRTVTAVRTSAGSLGSALASRLPIAEVRRAHLIQSPAELDLETQRRWTADLAERSRPAADTAPAVCLLDTGVYSHSLFEGSLEATDIHYVVSADGVDRNGHGTQMSGLALFGDLRGPLTSATRIQLDHRLESVKILPDAGHNPKETYGAVTASGAATPEALEPHRRRTYLLTNSDSDSSSDGRPTLWSATIDALSAGTDVVAANGGIELLSMPDPESSRLFVVAAGNVRDGYRLDFLDDCDASAIEDPGQAFNALTVGAYTEMSEVPQDPDFAGYTTLAPPGEISPFSRTSLLFADRWALKPDIVLEGGNLLVSPDLTHFDQHDVVMLTTTSLQEPQGQPLTSANATSAAAAQAGRLAATASALYPDMWPETLRGLLVHSAEWTERMDAEVQAAPTKSQRMRLLGRYGFGVPTLERVLRSASSAVTLVAQAEIQPFSQEGANEAKLREMHLHDLPWPREQLLDLGDTPVRMRVTLSYFVEPNPSSRGWRGRYTYPSHGLRFDIRRPSETTAEFRRRLNKLAEVEEGQTQRSTAPEPSWMIGPVARSKGSLHGDLWQGTAAELADSGVLGVYPVGGWWKNNNRRDRNELHVRYGLLVSLVTPEIGIDLYTPIATQIGIPVEIKT